MSDGETPLYAACKGGFVGAVELLLAEEANVNLAKVCRNNAYLSMSRCLVL